MGSTGEPGRLSPLIRPADAEDAQGLADLLTVLGYPCQIDEAAERLKTLRNDPDQQILVADWHGGLLGLICYDLMYYLPLGALTCRITALSVAQSTQRRGIGRSLLREVEGRARTAGVARIELTSADTRRDAHAFYRACGYAESALRFVKRMGDA